ncbi:MAG: translation initiation factor IF-3 [Acutalibacter sp.]|jgi:translation initiation factor IF-3
MEVLPISNKELQINEQIRDKELRVIDSDGTQLGIMPLRKAMEIAEQKNLDLVKIAPQANPPVCKIIDYGKFRFEQAKREKEARKNQRVVEIKEVRLSLNIDTHDFETKKNHALRFISEGNKVKASIRFRGREMGHPELGLEIMKRFADAMSEVANVEKPAKLEGRTMLMFLAPKPQK